MERYVPEEPQPFAGTGNTIKLLNRRVTVAWDDERQVWMVIIRGLVDRKTRKVNVLKFILGDEAMRAMVALALQIAAHQWATTPPTRQGDERSEG